MSYSIKYFATRKSNTALKEMDYALKNLIDLHLSMLSRIEAYDYESEDAEYFQALADALDAKSKELQCAVQGVRALSKKGLLI